VVLGLLAVRSRSLLPGIVFHGLNNAFALAQGPWINGLESAGLAAWIYRNPAEGLYHEFWVMVSGVVSALLFFYLWKIDRQGRFASDLTAKSVV
jgi:sodium transport system permease protein